MGEWKGHIFNLNQQKETTSMRESLKEIGVITGNKIELEFEDMRVRMMKDLETGVIFMDHEPPIDYTQIESLSYWKTADLSEARKATILDDQRRFDQFSNYINGAHILDFGCGNGGFLNLCRDWANKPMGYEIQADAVEVLKRDGLNVSDKLPDDKFDNIFMFHVLEHLTDQVGILKTLKAMLNPGGSIIIEVPHARDFLMEFLDMPEFRAKTYTNEYHTILHTKESLEVVLRAAGFKNIEVDGYQRYSINNHLYYAHNKKPGNNMRTWDFLLSPGLRHEYAQSLIRLGMTDTLIAVAEA